MIYVYRQGGLGNQLFQVSNAFAISKRFNQPLSISQYTDKKRYHYNDTIFKNFLKCSSAPADTFCYNEPSFQYTEICNVTNNFMLFGHYQSEKYFKEYRNEILELFTLPTKVYIPQDGATYVSVHVRRTDYTLVQEIHPIQPIAWYFIAMEYLREHVPGCRFVIFSDDIAWCKQQMLFGGCYLMNGTNAVEDLFNMSLCDHHIIANSSFSWWSSYLCKNPDKKVLAPRNWFGPKGPQNYQDLFREEFVLIG